jgi:hypothetical protein
MDAAPTGLDLESPTRTVATFGLVHASQGRGTEGKRVATQALAMAAELPHDAARARLCDLLLPLLITTGLPGEAKAFVDGLADEKDQAQERLAVALAENGMLDDAEAVATSIEDGYRQVWALSRSAQAAASAGDAKSARRLALRARGAARAADAGQSRRNELLGEAATALAAAGEHDEALALAHAIDDTELREDLLTRLGRATPETEMVEAPLVSGRGPDTLLAPEIPAGKTDDGGGQDQRELAIGETLRAQANIADESDPEQRAADLAKLSQAWTALGEVTAAAQAREAALATARGIVSSVNRKWPLIWMASAFVESGDTERLLAAIDEMPDSESRAEALEGVASATAEIVGVEEALLLWRRAFRQARETSQWSVYRCLDEGAFILGALDGGKTLTKVYDMVLELESWWRRPI